MTMHRIQIRLNGMNTFTEKFPGSSVNDAIQIASQRYPGARNITWLGGAQTDEQEAETKAFFDRNRREVRETNERVFGSNNDITRPVESVTYDSDDDDNDGPNLAEQAASAGLLGSLIILFVTIGLVVLFFPVVLGWLTMCLGRKIHRAATPNPKMYLSLIISLSAFAGGLAGGYTLQREYMPEVADQQVEWVQNIRGAIKDQF